MVFCGPLTGGISEVLLPKKAVLKNWRLGLVLRLLQIGALVGAVAQLWHGRYTEFSPTMMQVVFWTESGDPGPENPAHCVNVSSFHYKYNHNPMWDYTPQGCRDLEIGEDYKKNLQEAYVLIYVLDTVEEKQFGDENCSALALRCQDSGGGFTAINAQEMCTCSAKEEYYVKNPEHKFMVFRHSFSVQDGLRQNSIQRGNSAWTYHTVESESRTERREGKLLTNIMKMDGKPCVVGGKSQYLSGEGDIGGSLEDWLACGDLGLDSQSEITRSKHPKENMAPHLRTTGVLVSLELRYSNRHDDIRGDVKTVCDVFVTVSPAWNSRLSTDIIDLTGEGGSDERRPSESYNRRAYGVSFTFAKGGSFSYFHPHSAINGIINAVILLRMPLKICGLIALHCIGIVSTIYRRVLNQKFSIFEHFHGLSTRMMTGNMGFRAVTGQWTTPTEDLKAMVYPDVEEKMFEAFAHNMQDSRSGEMKARLQEDEMKKLSNVVFMGLDRDETRQIHISEFMHACTSSELVNSELMVRFFDSQDLSCQEHLLDPTRSQIQALLKLYRQKEEAADEVQSMARPSEAVLPPEPPQIVVPTQPQVLIVCQMPSDSEEFVEVLPAQPTHNQVMGTRKAWS